MKFKNSGKEDWPSDTHIYQVNYSKYSAFRDDDNEC